VNDDRRPQSAMAAILPPPFRPAHRMLYRHDPMLAHRFVPGTSVRIPGPRGGIFVRTNAQGFRSDWDFTAAKGDRPRVLFFGDSLTAGDGCENSERFSDVVGQILGAETYNYGLPGSGTDQQLLVLRHCAGNVEADALVLALYVENIERNKVSFRWTLDGQTGRLFRMPKPYFALDGGRLTLRNSPVPNRWPLERAGGGPRDLRRRMRAATRRTLRRSPRLNHLAYSLARSPFGSWLKRVIGAGALPDYRSAGSEGWQLLEAILREFRSAAGSTPVVLVPIPTYSYLVDDLPQHYQQRFEELARSLPGLHVLDLTAALRRMSRAEKLELLQPDLTHFTPAGHRRAAEVIAEGLQRFVPAVRAPRIAAPARTPSRHVWVLGISCFFHDAGAALIKDGQIVAAALEERFSRVKHDPRFPRQAINYCLEEGGIHPSQLSAVGYHQNLGLNLERMFDTLLLQEGALNALHPGVLSEWFEQKLRLSETIRRELAFDGPLYQGGHHRSHAAAAFFPSPFERAAVLTIDGVGEWVSATLGVGRGNALEIRQECRFPQSVGLFYSAVTRFLGFRANTDEYKIMGLAPYGAPRFTERMREELIRIENDGSVELHEAFRSPSFEPMAAVLTKTLGIPVRSPSQPLRSEHADVARSLQELLEEVVLRMAAFARRETNESHLCLAGGVALNCVATGRLLREGIFDDVWIQPAADDSGSSLGVALDLYYTQFQGERRVDDLRTQQRDSCLGPSYSDAEIQAFLDTYGRPYETLSSDDMAARVADLLRNGKIVGRFAGRGEFGPRALGSRSILADPRDRGMQAEVNRRIKQREGFRPFAPAVLEEVASTYFELDRPSPYMSFAVPIVSSHCRKVPALDGEDLLVLSPPAASDIPAVTHIDHSARVQTVSAERSPAFHGVISAFGEKTGCPVVLNTSFNVNDEPIVWTPYDAYRCFMRSGLDALSMGPALLLKEMQPPWSELDDHASHGAPPGASPLSRRLHKVLLGELARVRDAARKEIGRSGSRGPTGWRPGEHPDGATPVPEWPRSSGEVAAFVENLTAQWTPWLRDAFRAPLVRLVRMATARAQAISIVPPRAVNDDLYVLF
jgi:carbamoyltransferase